MPSKGRRDPGLYLHILTLGDLGRREEALARTQEHHISGPGAPLYTFWAASHVYSWECHPWTSSRMPPLDIIPNAGQSWVGWDLLSTEGVSFFRPSGILGCREGLSCPWVDQGPQRGLESGFPGPFLYAQLNPATLRAPSSEGLLLP